MRAKPPTRRRKGEDSTITAVDRATHILMAFVDAADSLSLSEIAGLSKLSKPTTLRFLATLVGDGMVAQHEGGTYSLGFLPLRAADTVLHGTQVWHAARPVMRHIRDMLNETVVLSIRDGDMRYNIDCLESTRAIGQTQMIGIPIPLHIGAAGLVLLAAMSDAAIETYVGRQALRSLPRDLLRDIRQIRRRQFAASTGDYQPEGHAIACAILDTQGQAVAALHVSTPRGRYSKELERRCLAALSQGARNLTAAPHG